MKLEDIPPVKGARYPARINVPLTLEQKRKLDLLKKEGQKDTVELIRMLLDDFFKTIDFDSAG